MSLFNGTVEYLPLGKLPFKLELALSFLHYRAISTILNVLIVAEGVFFGIALVSYLFGTPLLFTNIVVTPETFLMLTIASAILLVPVIFFEKIGVTVEKLKSGEYRSLIAKSDDFSFKAILTPAIWQRADNNPDAQQRIINTLLNWELVWLDRLIREGGTTPADITRVNRARIDAISLIMSELAPHGLVEQSNLIALTAEAHEDQERNNDILRKELERGEAVVQMQPSIR